VSRTAWENTLASRAIRQLGNRGSRTAQRRKTIVIARAVNQTRIPFAPLHTKISLCIHCVQKKNIPFCFLL